MANVAELSPNFARAGGRGMDVGLPPTERQGVIHPGPARNFGELLAAVVKCYMTRQHFGSAVSAAGGRGQPSSSKAAKTGAGESVYWVPVTKCPGPR